MPLFFIITLVFAMLAAVSGMALDLVKTNPGEDAPDIIKKFYSTYILGIVILMIIYLYFLVAAYALDKPDVIGGVVIVLTIVVAFIMMVISADAARKIDKGKYKKYWELFTGLAASSGIMIVLMVLMILYFRRKNAS